MSNNLLPKKKKNLCFLIVRDQFSHMVLVFRDTIHCTLALARAAISLLWHCL